MQVFDDKDALIFHQRLAEPCLVCEWSVVEGCTEDQKEKIRKGDKGDEYTRWKRMFGILFPEIEHIPDGTVYDNAFYAAQDGPFDPNLMNWQGEQSAQTDHDMASSA